MPNTYCQDVSILTLFSEVTQTTTDFDFSPVKNKFALRVPACKNQTNS